MYTFAVFVAASIVICVAQYGYEALTNKRYDNAGARTFACMLLVMIVIAICKVFNL